MAEAAAFRGMCRPLIIEGLSDDSGKFVLRFWEGDRVAFRFAGTGLRHAGRKLDAIE